MRIKNATQLGVVPGSHRKNFFSSCLVNFAELPEIRKWYLDTSSAANLKNRPPLDNFINLAYTPLVQRWRFFMPRGKIRTLKIRSQQVHDRISGVMLEVRCGPVDGYSDLHVITKDGKGAIFKFDGFGRLVGIYQDEKEETFFPYRRPSVSPPAPPSGSMNTSGLASPRPAPLPPIQPVSPEEEAEFIRKINSGEIKP